MYNDYQPDVILKKAYSDSLIIDINQDNINDVVFYLGENSTGNWSKVKTINSQCQFSEIQYYPSDSLKSSTISWHSGDFNVLGFEEFNFGIKMGIKILSNELNYYGWIKVSNPIIDRTRVVIIDKYAFCTIPNYPLLWGQTEIITGTSELKEDTGIKVYATDSGSQLVVQSSDVIKSIRVIDLLGATVVVKDNIRDKQATLSTKGLVHGTYIVKVTNSNLKEYTSKIVF